MTGWRVPGYVVEELLGFGASGQVWRGRVSSTGAAVALKRVTIGDVAQVRAAQREAALLTTLDHPHLVRLHELVPAGDAVVLVLDLADGGTLAELVAARASITPGEAITALAPIGAALAYVHNAGVVHGDVTPANVLFTDAGMPLLADLGVARLHGDDPPAHSTPAFIDPAVAVGHVPGPQSDVFMLGAVLLHALTGRPLWSGESSDDVLASAAAADEDEIAAAIAAPDIPEPMRAVLSRALSVAPSARGTAAEFALDLRHAATPVAVELAAGRQRVVSSAPAEPPMAGEWDGADTRTVRPDWSDAARPPFDRPREVVPDAARPVLTHAVRPRPRPLPNRGGARRARRPTLGPARARWAALVAVIAVAAVTGVTWVVLGDQGASRAAPAAGSSGASGASASATPTAHPPVPTMDTSTMPAPTHLTASGQVDAAGVEAVLTRLDKLRERAFADRDPGLLASVYVSGPLLNQDVALLKHIVPAGCGLIGVHTTYDDIRVTGQNTAGVSAVVSATLSDSLLSCGGTRKGRAPGAGPSALHVTLSRHGSNWLISVIAQ
jgi:hypothetical protein